MMKTPAYPEDEYPMPVQAAGQHAMLTYDRLLSDLLGDGYTADEAAMLLAINLDQVLHESQHTTP